MERLPTPVFWPGEFHGLYSPWGPKELDTTERLSLLLSCTLLSINGIKRYTLLGIKQATRIYCTTQGYSLCFIVTIKKFKNCESLYPTPPVTYII